LFCKFKMTTRLFKGSSTHSCGMLNSCILPKVIIYRVYLHYKVIGKYKAMCPEHLI
jgi:hypothetical protein